jgi:hypothetical protein
MPLPDASGCLGDASLLHTTILGCEPLTSTHLSRVCTTSMPARSYEQVTAEATGQGGLTNMMTVNARYCLEALFFRDWHWCRQVRPPSTHCRRMLLAPYLGS